MKPIYFKTRDEAWKAAEPYKNQHFKNVYQYKGECTTVKINEFKKGFAIQFGDYGPYLQKNEVTA
jgi:hypothetical protein